MWKYNSKKRDKYYNEVIRLYTEEKLGCVKISRIVPIGESTISRWVSTFVSANQSSICMAKSAPFQQASPFPDSEYSDVKADEISTEEADVLIKALQAEIAQLKKQLAHEPLRADAFDGLLNVAEKQFNISMR